MAATTRNIDGTTPWSATPNPNSARINYTAGTTKAQIMTEIQNFVAAHGWTKIDQSASGEIVVFSAPNNVLSYGPSTKWMKLDLSSASTINIIGSILAPTGTPQITFNTTYINSKYSTTAYHQRWDGATTDGDIYLSCTAAHFGWYNVCNNGTLRGGATNIGSNFLIEVGIEYSSYPVTSSGHVVVNDQFPTNTSNGCEVTSNMFGSTSALSNYGGFFTDKGAFGVIGSTMDPPSGDMMTNVLAFVSGLNGKPYATSISGICQASNSSSRDLTIVGGIPNWHLIGVGTYMDTVTVKTVDGFISDVGADTEYLCFPCFSTKGTNHLLLK